jgi:hypothetical protein
MADKLTRSLHLVPPSLRSRARYEEALFQAVFERQFAAWRKAGYGDFIAVLSGYSRIWWMRGEAAYPR